MSYFQDHKFFTHVLNHKDLDKKIYSKLLNGDLADVLLSALDILKETDSIPKFEKTWKNIKTSNEYREEGNKAYMAGHYHSALKYYNQALLHAPLNSNSMLLAYSNRSALFNKTKNYSACMKDIDTCLKIGCSNDILEKLTKRKKDCSQNMWKEQNRFHLFSNSFFKNLGQRHPQVPCITNDVKISINPDTGLPKVTAAKDMKIGTIVGVEKAFTLLLNPVNHYNSCYYCHKMSLNLMPCPNCVYALFCNSECRNLCMKESHSVECSLMELLCGGFCGPYSRITFRTVIKTKLMCDTWKEFIDASYNIGNERMKNSPIAEIYDGSYKFAMLNFVELRDMKLGAMFSFAFMCATFIHYLTNLPFFLPIKKEEKNDAIWALARMTMTVLLKFFNKIEINNVAEDRNTNDMVPAAPNLGYFAFASKLRHQCESNLLVMGLCDRIGLVAVQPIKKGEELTICYVDHAYDYRYSPTEMTVRERALELYRFATVCRCPSCTQTWQVKGSVDDNQRRMYRRWMTQTSDVLNQGQPTFKPTCDLMTSLHQLVGTKEHQAVYTKFRSILCIFQLLESKSFSFSERCF